MDWRFSDGKKNVVQTKSFDHSVSWEARNLTAGNRQDALLTRPSWRKQAGVPSIEPHQMYSCIGGGLSCAAIPREIKSFLRLPSGSRRETAHRRQSK